MQEHRIAAKAAEELEKAGCEVVTGVGGTGVVACYPTATGRR
jgi:metal-dependent amidase/aminoacylase/carboxypeptidase family protein